MSFESKIYFTATVGSMAVIASFGTAAVLFGMHGHLVGLGVSVLIGGMFTCALLYLGVQKTKELWNKNQDKIRSDFQKRSNASLRYFREIIRGKVAVTGGEGFSKP